MEVTTIETTPVLMPNENHRNFTESGQFIEKDTVLNGSPKQIQGLRKGRPFIYKFFITKQGQIIHLKKVKPMRATEVTLGADSQVSPTKVNMKNVSSKSNKKYIGAILGAGALFAYAKYKKHDKAKQIALSVTGALVGFCVGYYLEGGASNIKVQPSK